MAARAPRRGTVYARSGPTWTLAKTISAPTSAWLGWDIALADDVLAIGSGCYNDYQWSEATVHVHERDASGPGAWGRVSTISDGNYIGGSFGKSVSLAGGLLVVAEHADLYFCGSEPWPLHLYARDLGGPSAWGRLAVLQPPPGMPSGSSYGRALQMSGSLILANDNSDVHVLDRNAGGPNAWSEQTVFSSLGPFAIEASRLYLNVFVTPNWRLEVRDRHLGGENAWGLAGELVASDGAPLGNALVTTDGRVATTAWNAEAVYVFESPHHRSGPRAGLPARPPAGATRSGATRRPRGPAHRGVPR